MWQGSCGAAAAVVSSAKNSGGSSPCWISSAPQSIVAPSSRGGVPVFSRPKANPARLEALRQRDRRPLPEPSSGRADVAEMNHAAQKCAGGEHDRTAAEASAVGQVHAADGAVLGQDPGRFALDDREAGRSLDQRAHGPPVERAVGLRPRPLDGRPLAAIEDAELDAGGVRGARHDPVQRVDLAHQMALADAADRRIAGHLADRRGAIGDERGRSAAARRSGRRLAARVSAADHDDVKAAIEGPGCFT